MNIFTAFLSVCLASAPLAQAAIPAPAQETGAEAQEIDWQARSRRVSFDRRTAQDARLDIAQLPPEALGRRSALVALGASGSYASRDVLLEQTKNDLPAKERAAAIYGLGELGHTKLGESIQRLQELAQDPYAEVAEAALVALVRSGSVEGRRTVQRQATGTSSRAVLAQEILNHRSQPRTLAPPPPYRRLYVHLWDAGRSYGLVDGKLWSTAVVDELAKNPQFLSALVFDLAVQLNLPGTKDHLLEILLDGTGAPRIDAAVGLMPLELEDLIASELWRPEDLAEWERLFQGIVVGELQEFFPQTLALALEQDMPSLHGVAAAFLFRPNTRFEDTLGAALDSDIVTQRAHAAYAVGAAGLTGFTKRLDNMAATGHPLVVASAMTSLLRLGASEGRERVGALLRQDPAARPKGVTELLFQLLERAAPDKDVVAFLESLSTELEGRDRAAVDSILILSDVRVGTDVLREEIPLMPPRSLVSAMAAKALALRPGGEDIETLRRLFPRENAIQANLALAAGLARIGDQAPLELLRSAVWTLPLGESILAAGVARQVYGERTLVSWATHPPVGVREEDVRRLGYAIGEFGGMQGVEALQRAFGTSDGAEIPAIQGAILGALTTRTR